MAFQQTAITTLSITSATNGQFGTVVINPDGTLTYTPGAMLAPGGDSFTYTVSDGVGGTATRTVTVVISSPVGFNKLSGPTPVGGGQLELNYLGIPGEKYALDEAADLTPPITWVPLVTNTASGNGTISFAITPVNESGFFRTRHVP